MDFAKRMQPLLLLVPALVVALALDQGGFDPSAWVWSGALAAWAAAAAVVASRDVRIARTAWAWASAVALVLAWVALSWLWSDRRAQTVLEIRRTVVYAAAVLALVALVRRGATRRSLLLLTHAAITAVVVDALAGYLAGPRSLDTFEGALLAQPLGYANALGALAAIGVVLGIGLAAHAAKPIGPLAAATVPALAAALPLTESRGAAAALAIGLLTTLACTDDAAPLARAALLVAPGSALAAITAATSRLSDGNARPYAHAALVVGGTVIVCVAGTATAAAAARRAPRSRRRTPRLAVSAALVAALVATGAATATSEPRASLWGVAWHQFEKHIVLGSGAGTFARAWARSGLIAERGGALDAHSLYLETLAELGVVGAVLLLAFLSVPLLRARQSPVAAGAYVAFLVHAGLDWDWEMPAVVLAGLCCGAAALAVESDQARALAPRGRATLVALALALGVIAIAGARSSSEPGVSPPRSVAVVLGARVAVLPGAVPVALPVRVLRARSRAGRQRVAVAEVGLQGLARHGDHVPRMLPRVRAVADLHAVLPARRAVLAG